MLRRLLWFLSGRLRVRVILADGQPLFERYFLARLPRGGAMYLHHYLRSDPDRGHHDHPWNLALAIPLAGGYIETRLKPLRHHRNFYVQDHKFQVRAYRRAPIIGTYFLRPSDFHRLLLANNTTSWSLFAHTRRSKSWGFMSLEGEYRDAGRLSDSSWRRSAPLGREIERAGP